MRSLLVILSRLVEVFILTAAFAIFLCAGLIAFVLGGLGKIFSGAAKNANPVRIDPFSRNEASDVPGAAVTRRGL